MKRTVWTALELDAIQRLCPDGRIETVVRDGRIRWPDSIAFHQGEVYFTLSQIHLAWPFNWGFPPRRDPYFLFKVRQP